MNPDWSYLDVHSAWNPSGYYDVNGVYGTGQGKIDYEDTARGAGLFRSTLNEYRALPGVLHTYGGSVQGEGGYQFLYAGYFDDFDGALKTADPRLGNVDAPLLVDFDLMKIHQKSNQHGMGHIGQFLELTNPWDLDTLKNDTASVQKYVATELAFGHGGLITKSGSDDQTVYQAILEFKHVFPMQHSYLYSVPTSIEYFDVSGNSVGDASTYIRDHSDYAHADSSGYMARVKITYANGAVVCVNRSSSSWSVSRPGPSGGWHTWNVTTSGPQCGTTTQSTFVLAAKCGWVCYSPDGAQQGMQ